MIRISITCDGCGAVARAPALSLERVHLHRAAARVDGWRVGITGPTSWTTGPRDYCPACVAEWATRPAAPPPHDGSTR